MDGFQKKLRPESPMISMENFSGFRLGFSKPIHWNYAPELTRFEITGDRVAEMVSKIVPLGREVDQMRITKESEINPQQPENSIRIAGKGVVYYNSASIMGNNWLRLVVKKRARDSQELLLPGQPRLA